MNFWRSIEFLVIIFLKSWISKVAGVKATRVRSTLFRLKSKILSNILFYE